MPKGTRNGSSEFAKAYVHGRIDATRELLIARVDKKLDRELNLWCFRFSLNPMEIKQDLGAISLTAQTDSLPGSGVQYATEQRQGHALAALEVVERAHGVRPSLGSGSGNSQNAPGQIEAATPAKRDSSKIKGYWAAMTLEQRAAVMRDKLLKTAKHRELTPSEKARLKTFKAKAGNTVTPKRDKKATKAKTGKARKAGSQKRLTKAEHSAKQRIYVARSAARKKGLPPPPLPSKLAAA